MIKSKKDYNRYVKAECGYSESSLFVFNWLSAYLRFQPIKRFLLLLRTSEYLKNVRPWHSFFTYPIVKVAKVRLGIRLSYSIPENVFGCGLQLPHYGTIVVNPKSQIGENCRIHVCTNIGASGGSKKAPKIGDNVYIAPGAKIYGDITIANNIAIAANAAVSKSFENEGMLIGGVPAKELMPYDVSEVIPTAK